MPSPGTDPESPSRVDLAARDGTALATYRWPVGDAPRAHVLLVHGLGEHAGRYRHVARHLGAWGFAVHAYDQRGHGRSAGARGRLPRPDDLLTDLATVLDAVRAATRGPLILLGHSLGGLVAAQFVARAVRPVDALVLTSPALAAGLSAPQRLQLAIGRALVPDLAMWNQLDPTLLSHDPAVVRAYRDDPLVHDRVTARLVRTILDAGAEVRARAASWTVPTLLLWAGADRIVDPAGSAEFATRAPAPLVETRCFGALYHEIMNEADASEVFATLERWLAARFPTA